MHYYKTYVILSYVTKSRVSTNTGTESPIKFLTKPDCGKPCFSGFFVVGLFSAAAGTLV